jgi:hypothetical protein
MLRLVIVNDRPSSEQDRAVRKLQKLTVVEVSSGLRYPAEEMPCASAVRANLDLPETERIVINYIYT